MKLSRRHLLGALLATAATPGVGAGLLTSKRPPKGRGPVLPPGSEKLVGQAGLKGDVVFAVADAQTGKVLEARGPDTVVAPASVTKAITALYALDTLGADHRFKTRVIATGGVGDGVVQGDLVLVGGGFWPPLTLKVLTNNKLKQSNVFSPVPAATMGVALRSPS